MEQEHDDFRAEEDRKLHDVTKAVLRSEQTGLRFKFARHHLPFHNGDWHPILDDRLPGTGASSLSELGVQGLRNYLTDMPSQWRHLWRHHF